jgi:hypothetical protein
MEEKINKEKRLQIKKKIYSAILILGSIPIVKTFFFSEDKNVYKDENIKVFYDKEGFINKIERQDKIFYFDKGKLL